MFATGHLGAVPVDCEIVRHMRMGHAPHIRAGLAVDLGGFRGCAHIHGGKRRSESVVVSSIIVNGLFIAPFGDPVRQNRLGGQSPHRAHRHRQERGRQHTDYPFDFCSHKHLPYLF